MICPPLSFLCFLSLRSSMASAYYIFNNTPSLCTLLPEVRPVSLATPACSHTIKPKQIQHALTLHLSCLLALLTSPFFPSSVQKLMRHRSLDELNKNPGSNTGLELNYTTILHAFYWPYWQWHFSTLVIIEELAWERHTKPGKGGKTRRTESQETVKDNTRAVKAAVYLYDVYKGEEESSDWHVCQYSDKVKPIKTINFYSKTNALFQSGSRRIQGLTREYCTQGQEYTLDRTIVHCRAPCTQRFTS